MGGRIDRLRLGLFGGSMIVAWAVCTTIGVGGANAGPGSRGCGKATEMLSVSIDPRMELLAVVQHFTSWAEGGHIKSNTSYKHDIDKYFGDFPKHRVVDYTERLVDAGFTHDAPVTFVLHHSDPPGLALETPYSQYLTGRADSEERLFEFSCALRDFAQETDFMRFYRSHQSLYDTLINEVKSLLSGKAYVQTLEDFYGDSRSTYNLILSPLFAGGYGPTVLTGEGYEIYGVIGPCALKNTHTTFACLGYLESMMLHEWSHSFVNPLVDENMDAFEESRHLFEPIKGMMKRQAYPNWRISLYEHVVRACEIHLRDNLHEEFNKEEFLTYQEGKGFWYIGCIDSLLNSYQRRRDEFPAFSDFVPVIASRLARLSVSDLPSEITSFAGPLDGIFPRTDRVYFIYPTAIDERAAGEIKRDLENLGQILSGADIDVVVLSDKEAQSMDWGDKVAFIYGTPKGNCFLAQIEPGIPLALLEDAIEFGGRRYESEDILLITCMPNPYNERLPFALAVANSPRGLIGAGLRMAGRSEWNVDYVMFEGDEQLTSGRYQKQEGTWSVVSE